MGNHWAKRWRQDAICSDVAIVLTPDPTECHTWSRTKALEFGTQMSSGYLSVQAGSKFEMQLFTLHHLDQRGPGSAATLPQGQLRPYPCQGSAATLPTRILWKGQRFLPLSRVSCDPTWPQCKESYRFSHCFEVIQVQVQHSFYQFFPPFWQHMLSMIDFSPLLVTHAFNDSGSRATFLLSIFPPPLATHAFNDSGSNTTFLLSKIFPPLATHAFNDSSSSTTFFLSIFSPPPWQPMLCDPTWQHSVHQIFPPLGNPCFQWFKFKYNIPFNQNFFPPPPWQPTPCDPTWQHSFFQISPPLATHAFNDWSSNTTFLLSNFSPPWQPMLSKIQVQVQHSFYQNFSPPLATHALRPYLTTFLLSNFPPPLGNPCFQWLKFEYNIPFINFSPPPWQPMLCDPTWQHSVHQIFPPLGNPCFQWFKFKYNIPFNKIFPPLGNPRLATLPDNIPFIKFFFIPLGNPCFQWFKFEYNIPFIKFFPPLATHAFNDSSSNTTFLLTKFSPPWQPTLCDPTWQHFLSNFPPPWQHMLSMIQVRVQHSFYQIFPPPPLATHALRLPDNIPPPLGNPCFQWFKFKYNIPFMKIPPPPPLGNPCCATLPAKIPFIRFPLPPLGNPCFATLPDNIPPPWQPMLSMIQIQVQHSFYQKISPPPLATHALRPYLTTFLLSNFPPPWQPMLSMIQVQVQNSFYQNFPPPLATHALRPYLTKFLFSNFPPLATHAFNDSSSSTTFLLSNFSPPPWQHMLSMIQVQVQHSFYQFSPPLGNPCFATLPDKIPFFKFSPLGNPCFQWLKFEYNIPFINFSPPLATHAFNDSSSSTTFLLSIFPPSWQPMLCDPTWQHSPPLGNPCFQWFKFKYNIPFIKIFPPPWKPMLCDPTWQHSFYQIFPQSRNSPPLNTMQKKQTYSSATLPNYCFPSTVRNTGRVTQHTIYSQT